MNRSLSEIMKSFGTLKFWKDLYYEIDQDQVFNSAASLSYYFLLAIFPAIIFLLTLLPYLPIENLSGELMQVIAQALPESAAKALETTIVEITTTKKQGLLSFGALFTLWSASSGLYAIMQELNTTYDVRETRPFWKVRSISIGLTIVFGIAIISSFALIVSGGLFQTWLDRTYVLNPVVPFMFQAFRWIVIVTLLTAGFAVLYFYGTNVKQRFKFITPGSVIAVGGLVVVSLLFRVYVSNFSDYSASYGSLGAVVVLMLWFYLVGSVILIGSEINALIESGPMKLASLKANAEFNAELTAELKAEFKVEKPVKNPTPPEPVAATTSGATGQPASKGSRL